MLDPLFLREARGSLDSFGHASIEAGRAAVIAFCAVEEIVLFHPAEAAMHDHGDMALNGNFILWGQIAYCSHRTLRWPVEEMAVHVRGRRPAKREHMLNIVWDQCADHRFCPESDKSLWRPPDDRVIIQKMSEEDGDIEITMDDFARRFSMRPAKLMWFLGAGVSAAAGILTAWDTA